MQPNLPATKRLLESKLKEITNPAERRLPSVPAPTPRTPQFRSLNARWPAAASAAVRRWCALFAPR